MGPVYLLFLFYSPIFSSLHRRQRGVRRPASRAELRRLERLATGGGTGEGDAKEIHIEPAERSRHPRKHYVAMEGEGDTGGVGGTVATGKVRRRCG